MLNSASVFLQAPAKSPKLRKQTQNYPKGTDALQKLPIPILLQKMCPPKCIETSPQPRDTGTETRGPKHGAHLPSQARRLKAQSRPSAVKKSLWALLGSPVFHQHTVCDISVCALVCAHGSQRKVSSVLSVSVFETGFSVNLNLTLLWIGRLASQPPTCIHLLLGTGVMGMCLDILHGCWEFNLRSSCLHSKCYYPASPLSSTFALGLLHSPWLLTVMCSHHPELKVWQLCPERCHSALPSPPLAIPDPLSALVVLSLAWWYVSSFIKSNSNIRG